MTSIPPGVTGRLTAEVRPRTAVWLDPALDALRPGLASRARWVDQPRDARVIIMRARRIGLDGTIEQPEPPSLERGVLAGLGADDGPFVLAVTLLGAAPPDRPDRIVAHCRGQVRAARVLCEQAVLDVVDGELVIVELAKGVSARDLQARVEPTLLVSPRVKEMVATAPPAIVEWRRPS